MQVEVAKTEKISSMPPSMLVSATYDNISRSAVLKFYDPKSQKLILWLDEIGHKPYYYSKLDPDHVVKLNLIDEELKIHIYRVKFLKL